MQDGEGTSISQNILRKKQKRKFVFKNKEIEIFETSKPNWKIRFRMVIFVIFASFSSITISSKICFTSVISNALWIHLGHAYPLNQIEWIARLYPIIVLCLIPITTALIDHWMISYRFSLIVSGALHVMGCVTSSTITHPLFFVLTDSLICALGSAITFSVFFLAIDDLFPRGNKLRVLTTTLCQGSTILSLFISELLSYVAKERGWLTFQISMAIVFSLEVMMLIVSCPEYGFNITVRRRGGPSEVTPITNSGTLMVEPSTNISNKILGLTFIEINKSPSMFSFLVYRFSMSVMHQGITLLILLDSQIITTPSIETLLSKHLSTTIATLVYATGEVTFFLLGAIFGIFMLGYLLHISISFLCIMFLVSAIWQPIRLQIISESMIVGHIVCAGITGGCIGALNTCMTSLSEESTNIQSRRIYPFVKLIEGLAFTFTPFLFKILDSVSEKNIWLLTFSVMSAANACFLVFILHKLYKSYRTNPCLHKTTIQASMKPVHLFVGKSGSN